MSVLAGFAPSCAEPLLRLGVEAKMGQLLSEEAGRDGAREALKAQAYVATLAAVSGRDYGAVRREVERRARARLDGVGPWGDFDPDQAEAEALAKPEFSLDKLTWREAEVLRTLAEERNEMSRDPRVLAVVRASWLEAKLTGKVPKTAVRTALRRLQDLELVYQRQLGTTVHYQPSAMGYEAVGVDEVKDRRFEVEASFEQALADLVEAVAACAFRLHREEDDEDDEADLQARLNGLALALSHDPKSLANAKRAANDELKRLLDERRQRDEARRAKRLSLTVVDAQGQLLPRELEVLREVVADHNRSVRSWNERLAEIGEETLPGSGRRLRDYVVSPGLRTEELQRLLQGRVAKSAVKRALTALSERNLVRYRLDAALGAGQWTATAIAFEALGVERASFDDAC